MSSNLSALWSHPRSLSTVVERVMSGQGSLTVLHEPFSYLYYVAKHPERAVAMNPDPERPHRYDSIRDSLLSASTSGPTFFKDMAYHCLDEVVQDSDFLRSVTHSFLVRDPMQAIASYFALNQNVTREEIGYEALWRLCERVGEVCGSTPFVIDADDLQRAPLKIMKSYCTAVGVEFRQESLEWKPTMEPEWDVWKGWHREVAASSGINRGHKRYRHTPRNHPLLRELYESQLPFYKKLRRLRIRQA